MSKILLLQFNIFIFSFTGIFSKLASDAFKVGGVNNLWIYLWVFLMLVNCGIYAIFWQINLRHFDVSVAYLHRSTYIIWNIIWATVVFKEHISVFNILGAALIIVGLLAVNYQKKISNKSEG
jgi:drug/metabolite transporter (DMT)-like permease